MAAIVLLSCVSKKVETKPGEKIPAEKLYTSDLFRKSLAYAKKLQAEKKGDKIFILSAKHHLLPLEKEIETYNETLNNKPRGERREWAKKVLEQLKEKCALDTDRFVILAGRNYYQDLIPHLPNHEMPMEGLGRGIGPRLHWLNERICNG